MIISDPAADKQFEVTPGRSRVFGGVGLDVRALKPTRRGLARQCLDWTERRHHLAGPLGGSAPDPALRKGLAAPFEIIARGRCDAEGVDRPERTSSASMRRRPRWPPELGPPLNVKVSGCVSR